MSAPDQPPRNLTLVELLGCLAGVTGAIGGATWGALNYGFWGLVLGAPIGLMAGVVCAWVLMIGGFVVLFSLAVLINYGPRKFWEFIRGRWEPPTGADEPTPPGE